MTSGRHYSSRRKHQEVQGDGKSPKRKEKELKAERFGFQNFPISKDSGPYSVVKDVGLQKANITIG